MNRSPFSVLFLTLLFCLAASTEAEERKKLFPLARGPFLEKCPCGPDSIRGPLRLLLRQGFRKADFRDSCRRHDACYDTIGSSRRRCDEAFLRGLLLDCRNSSHPRRCERKGRRYHRLVDRFGEGAFRSAQALARKIDPGG